MKIEIKNRFTGKLIFGCDADGIRLAVEKAVEAGISLRYADLRGAYLRYAYLRGADLRDADLSDAYLRGADLRDAYLRYAYLRGADLRGADLRDADLSDADLSDAYLRDADLRGADLRGADPRYADLRCIKNDFFEVLLHAIPEVPCLIAALKEGRVDGSTYQGECACLVGTVANIRKCSYESIPGLAPDSSRPAESFFLNIRKGDTPETNPCSKIAMEWAEEFQKLVAEVRAQ